MIYWHSLSDFLGMGGYGVYVWGSLAMTALVMAAELLQLAARRRRVRLANPGSSTS